MSTLSCRVTWFIAGSLGAKSFGVSDISWKGSSFAKWYGCLKYGCAGASQRKCVEYPKSSTLRCGVEIIGFAIIVLTVIGGGSLKR